MTADETDEPLTTDGKSVLTADESSSIIRRTSIISLFLAVVVSYIIALSFFPRGFLGRFSEGAQYFGVYIVTLLILILAVLISFVILPFLARCLIEDKKTDESLASEGTDGSLLIRSDDKTNMNN